MNKRAESEKRKIEIIFLDMDGVLFDFVSAALKVHGIQKSKAYAKWEPGYSEMHEAFGFSEDEFWSKINKKDKFWQELPQYEWIDKLYEKASEIAKTLILSAPSKNPKSAYGKQICLQKWKGYGFRDWIFTPAKHKKLLARPGALLIDDNDQNVEEFRKAGGNAILFPQRWNSGWRAAHRGIQEVLAELEEYAG